MSDINLSQTIPALTLIFLRALGMLLPFPIGEGIVKSFAKVGFAIVLAILFLPNPATLTTDSSVISVARVLSELVYGLMLGMPIALMISLAGGFGELFDAGRGQSIAQIFDPNQQQQVSSMGHFWHEAALMTCFLYGAPQVLLKSFASSLIHHPHLELATVISPDSARALLLVISKCWGQMMLVALPLLSVFILVELCIAAIGKVAPQLCLNAESFQIKSLLAFVLCAVAGVDQILKFWWQNISLVTLGG